uniref:Uncharacterized protein n=1 Tax=Rhodosorus marinus TaxID=101924 RepID=A0A7S0BT69_9RHOD|mmetsp:Transcript_7473/g.11187  ORF Transcript_7473/g.11187 Transcript_7473/m.11187 type:complete len:126 (+) Transcript_7473:134-511(+)
MQGFVGLFTGTHGTKAVGRVVCKVHRGNGQRIKIVDSKGVVKMRIADKSLLSSAKSFFDDFGDTPKDGGDLDVFPCGEMGSKKDACYLTQSGMVFKMELSDKPETELIELGGKSTIDLMNEIAKS